MTVEDGILFKNRKIIIYRSLKDEYLERIHSGHQGIEKCLEKAKEFVYWNEYANDIKETVEKCSLCQETRRSGLVINSSMSAQYLHIYGIP